MALHSLVGSESLQRRLIYAAEPLKQLHPNEIEQLPDAVRDRFKSVVDDLTKHPAPANWAVAQSIGGIASLLFGRSAASVRKLTPCQRAKIAEDILSMFVALSRGL